jgi:hypothetical protein
VVNNSALYSGVLRFKYGPGKLIFLNNLGLFFPVNNLRLQKCEKGTCQKQKLSFRPLSNKEAMVTGFK